MAILNPIRSILIAILFLAVIIAPVMAAFDNIVLIMGGYGGSYKKDTWNSTDNGATWNLVNASVEWTARASHSSVVISNSSIVLMGGAGAGGRTNDVWNSTDGGNVWTLVNASAEWDGRYLHSSVAMPDGSIVLMGGVDNGGTFKDDVWRSTDGGDVWIQMNASAGWVATASHTSVVMPDGSIIFMGGSDSGFTQHNETWRSTDNGATWTNITGSPGWMAREAHTSVVTSDGSIVLMGGDASPAIYLNDTWNSTDYGVTWTEINASSGWVERIAHTSTVMSDNSIILMGGYDGGGYRNDTWRSTNNGTTWTEINASSGWTKRYSHTSVIIPAPPPTIANTIYGLVLDDNTGLAISGATVNIRNATYSSTTLSFNYAGIDGVYWFENLPDLESYYLNATKIGYTRHADVIVTTGPPLGPGTWTRQDLYLTPAYTLTLTLTLNIRDATSSALITSVPVGIVYTGGSTSTSTGTAIIPNVPPGIIYINATAAGYNPYTTAYMMTGDLNATIYMTPLSVPVQNIFYTPWQVRIQIVDYYQNPLPGTNVTAYYVATTLPSTNISWLINAFAVSPTVAAEMTNSGVAMAGQTDNNGGLNFAMFKSIAYNLWIFNATSGINVNKTLYPADQEYRIRVPLASQIPLNNTLQQMSKTSLPVYQLNASCYNLSLIYEDLSGLTTGLWFKVWARNGTYFLNTDEGNPGTSMVVDNFTICYQPMGTEILWGYGAQRTGT